MIAREAFRTDTLGAAVRTELDVVVKLTRFPTPHPYPGSRQEKWLPRSDTDGSQGSIDILLKE